MYGHIWANGGGEEAGGGAAQWVAVSDMAYWIKIRMGECSHDEPCLQGLEFGVTNSSEPQ